MGKRQRKCKEARQGRKGGKNGSKGSKRAGAFYPARFWRVCGQKWENAILALTPTTGDDLPRIRFSSIKKDLDFSRVRLDALGDGMFVPCLDRLHHDHKILQKMDSARFPRQISLRVDELRVRCLRGWMAMHDRFQELVVVFVCLLAKFLAFPHLYPLHMYFGRKRARTFSPVSLQEDSRPYVAGECRARLTPFLSSSLERKVSQSRGIDLFTAHWISRSA